MKGKKIIIDTDIGGDPDDMFALIMALNNPLLDVLAIITGDEYKTCYRARFVLDVLKKMGRDKIPVFSGADLGRTKDFIVENLIDFSGGVVEDFDSDKIADIVRNNISIDEKIYYLSIQGLSNLACLLKSNHDVKEMLVVYQMGGAFNYRKKGIAEHNFRIDPEAAKYVFNLSGLDIKYILSDTTFKPDKIGISREHQIYDKIAKSCTPVLRVLKEHCDIFFEKRYPETILSDPLALCSIIDNDVLRFGAVSAVIEKTAVIQNSTKGKKICVSDNDFLHDRFIELVEQYLFK